MPSEKEIEAVAEILYYDFYGKFWEPAFKDVNYARKRLFLSKASQLVGAAEKMRHAADKENTWAD